MSASARRRRGALLLALALACGGLAASQVSGRASEVERQVGAPVPVVVARQDIPADRRLDAKRLRALLGVVQVPERFVARDTLPAVEEAAGLRTAVPIAAGSQLTLGQLRGAQDDSKARAGSSARAGERAVEVPVAGADALAEAGAPGARVDVLVSTEPREGPGRTFLALEGVELLGLRPGGAGDEGGGGGGEGAGGRASATATLRVTLRQAVYLTAAQNFAREVRLLSRPAGDRRRLGREAFSAADL